MGLERRLKLAPALKRSSLFLFGARQTGKTTLVRQQLPDAIYYNLNEANVFSELSARPELIRRRLPQGPQTVVVDEIQKFPSLLNEVQAIIDSRPDVRLVLTGSSARSLRRHGINLLGGRAAQFRLFPFTTQEVGPGHIHRILNYGSLPAFWGVEEPLELLQTYAATYIQEEIRAEGYIRNLQTFSRFLEVAAAFHGEVINFTKVGSDAGVPPRTVAEHFQLLEDTLVGYTLPSLQSAGRRKPVSNAKFYFFDIGVAHQLVHRHDLAPKTAEYGRALEHMVMLELKAWLSYTRNQDVLTFWRTYTDHEVDFVIGGHTGIEVKAKDRIQDRDLKGLRALHADAPLKRRIVVSLEEEAWRTDDGIEILPATAFFETLWNSGL
jgi:predicted AAA+ superfamily ATPase